jgi:tRNA pseudouridine65 synthase
VHRLDKATSGVLLFARGAAAARALGAAFEAGIVRKRYVALVRGWPLTAGEIAHPLARDPEQPSAGQPRVPAITRYRRLVCHEWPFPDGRHPTSRYALLEVEPLTGRRHQIRRHLKHVAHLLVGDSTHGKGAHNRAVAQWPSVQRLWLHATGLEVPGLHGRAPVVIEAPAGEEWQRLLPDRYLVGDCASAGDDRGATGLPTTERWARALRCAIFDGMRPVLPHAVLAPFASPRVGRRRFCTAAAGLAALGLGGMVGTRALAAPASPQGRLVVIGGAEDRRGDKEVLRRFVAVCAARRPGAAPRIAVLPAATAFPDVAWERYDGALADLGVVERVRLAVRDAQDAADPQWIATLGRVDGVLMGGGSQRRLMEVLNGTPLAQALRDGFVQGRLCVAGSSAGAAVLSQRMLVGRDVTEGLGLLPGAIVDQHFSERHRLPRLMAALSAQPHLLGIGVDEDTALVMGADGFEVVGSGGVTLIDARGMGRGTPGPAAEADADGTAAVPPGVRVLWLPAGSVHDPAVRRHAPLAQRLLAAALRAVLPEG